MLYLDDEEKNINDKNENQENLASNNEEDLNQEDLKEEQNDTFSDNEVKEDDYSSEESYDQEYEDEQYDNQTNEQYNSEYRPNNDYSNQNKKSNSKKAIWIVVSICMVLAILCTICVVYVSNAIKSYNEIINTTEATLNVKPPKTESTKEKPTTISTNVKQTETISTEAFVVNIEDIELEINDVGGQELTVKEVYKKASPSVVVITAYTSSGYGLGSGVVLTEDGYIVTNYHIANPTRTQLIVDFSDGTTCEATYLLGDEKCDVALIKVDKNDCVPAQLVNSDQIEVGDKTIVIGNALGRGITLTSGYVSALSRTITIDGSAMTLLQTDATINQGNSGGGVFNEYGQLIGIVNAKSGGTSIEGTGYAIPTNDFVTVIKDLMTKGYVTGKARLGITMNLIGSSYSSYNYIQIKALDEDGSAKLAGLQIGDIVYKIDGTEITSTSTLQLMLEKHKVGDTVTLTVLRPTKDLSEFAVTSWFGVVSYDYSGYLNACEEMTIELTFVEFNPNK